MRAARMTGVHSLFKGSWPAVATGTDLWKDMAVPQQAGAWPSHPFRDAFL